MGSPGVIGTGVVGLVRRRRRIVSQIRTVAIRTPTTSPTTATSATNGLNVAVDAPAGVLGWAAPAGPPVVAAPPAPIAEATSPTTIDPGHPGVEDARVRIHSGGVEGVGHGRTRPDLDIGRSPRLTRAGHEVAERGPIEERHPASDGHGGDCGGEGARQELDLRVRARRHRRDLVVVEAGIAGRCRGHDHEPKGEHARDGDEAET